MSSGVLETEDGEMGWLGDEMVVFTEVITFILDIFWVCFGAFCSSYFYTNSRKYSHLKSLTIYC
jgi:hypothetical protein